RREGLTPVMSETIRHGTLYRARRRQNSGGRARAGYSPLRTTFDRQMVRQVMRVAIRRRPLHATAQGAVSQNAQLLRQLALLLLAGNATPPTLLSDPPLLPPLPHH